MSRCGPVEVRPVKGVGLGSGVGGTGVRVAIFSGWVGIGGVCVTGMIAV